MRAIGPGNRLGLEPEPGQGFDQCGQVPGRGIALDQQFGIKGLAVQAGQAADQPDGGLRAQGVCEPHIVVR
ncbi:hypothetical protein D9M68_800370 [compost metagenome]